MTANSPRKVKKRKKSNPFPLFIVIASVLVAGIYISFQQGWLQSFFKENSMQKEQVIDEISVPDQTINLSASEETTGNSTNEKDSDNIDQVSSLETIQESDLIITQNSAPSNTVQPRGDLTGSETFNEESTTVDDTTNFCQKPITTIKHFYHHLDSQPYMIEYDLKESSEVHFSKLIQHLLNNPPIVSGEINDLFTILQNTAHFYRVIGKENIIILKGILDREKDEFETVLADFFSLLQAPSCLQEQFNLKFSEEALYDYAGFFLNTMGGRLYLFRRDSMSRMVVSYYAILLINRANANEANRHGIDIGPFIDQLIGEMESTSKNFRLLDLYLDKLYELKELYQ